MPKIYEYKGFVFFFYSNDHEPPHCHVTKGGAEMKIEFTVNHAGQVLSTGTIKKGRFNQGELKIIGQFIKSYHPGIVSKWNIFYHGKKKPKFEKINKL